jgi:hypothetical protein
MSLTETQARALPNPGRYAVEENQAGSLRFTLNRTGRRPLRFEGWQLVEASGQAPGASVWYDINVYETRAGTVVVELLVHREAAGEPDLAHVEVFRTLAEAGSWLEAYSPASDLTVAAGVMQAQTPLAWAVMQAVQLRQRLFRIEEDFRTLVSQVLCSLVLSEDPETAMTPREEAPLHAAE